MERNFEVPPSLTKPFMGGFGHRRGTVLPAAMRGGGTPALPWDAHAAGRSHETPRQTWHLWVALGKRMVDRPLAQRWSLCFLVYLSDESTIRRWIPDDPPVQTSAPVTHAGARGSRRAQNASLGASILFHPQSTVLGAMPVLVGIAP